MSTKLTLTIAGDKGEGKPKVLYVTESFDEAMEKILPLTPPSSSLESRGQCIWQGTDGRRYLCSSHYIATAEEDTDEE